MTTRERLIGILKEKGGKWVSGEELRTILGVSRAAVSKHVAGLKKAGYRIDSTPGRGYLLEETPDLLLPGEIRHNLSTSVFGKNTIEYYEITDSTNLRAKQLAEGGAREGDVVVAEEQTAGRGRKGRSWFSAGHEGICISLILRPAMSPAEASRITLMTAVAVAETLLGFADLDVKIKWPNDILIRGKKIAGILTELTMEMDAVDYVVVGLGLNVNTPEEHFSEEVRSIATSLLIETGKNFSRATVAGRFLELFEKYYEILKNEGFDTIMKRWKELSSIIGRDVVVDVIGRKYAGRVADIDSQGVLVIRDRDGQVHRIFSGDVTLSEEE